MSDLYSAGWAGSASSIRRMSAFAVASAMPIAVNPSACACLRDVLCSGGRVPTITVQPLSRAFAACTFPWIP